MSHRIQFKGVLSFPFVPQSSSFISNLTESLRQLIQFLLHCFSVVSSHANNVQITSSYLSKLVPNREDFMTHLFGIETLVRRLIEDDVKLLILWCDRPELKPRMTEA